MDTTEPRWWIRAATPTDDDREALSIQLFDFAVEAILEGDNCSDVYFTARDEAIRCAKALGIDDVPHQSIPGTGEVFGYTDHPTTQLLLNLISDSISTGDYVADIGSGTGRLATAAAQTAKLVIAVDIDWPAAQASQRALPAKSSHVVQGSADCLASLRFPVILANLHLAAWRQVAPEIARIAAPDALLLASGFLTQQEDEVYHLMDQYRWSIVAAPTLNGWLAVAATRQA